MVDSEALCYAGALSLVERISFQGY